MNDKTKTGVKLNLKHKVSSSQMTSATDDTLYSKAKKTPADLARESMNSNLTLDEGARVTSRTRNELYEELTKDERKLTDEDYFEFANPVLRAIAFGVDVVFAFALVKFSMMLAPLEAKIWHMIFLDKYKLQFILGEPAMIETFRWGTVALAVFLFIVIPVAFFNVSLGKKITKLRVRGDDKYTLSIVQAFQREILFKPISAACLIGFILPFFDKKKKSLHDKFAKTFVIKE